MKQGKRTHHLAARLGAIGTLLLACGLLGSAAAQASSYQQVGNFAGVPGELHGSLPRDEKNETSEENNEKNLKQWPEEVQLGALGGMAVNYTGAGGVPAGTIYASGNEGQGFGAQGFTQVARFNPDRSFSESWEVRSKALEEAREANGLSPYERCGPDGEAAYPNCFPTQFSESTTDVEVDQTTGNVYVYDPLWSPVVTEYDAEGTEVIARFGERAPDGEAVAASPAKVHASASGSGAIAVDGAGNVYVFDVGNPNFYHRLMVFEPKDPGHTEYEYAGQAHDISAGEISETEIPSRPVTDAAGNIYTAVEDEIAKFDPAHPDDPPLCEFFFKKGGIRAMTVDPLTGEVFLFSYVDKKIHRLNPCAEGKFSEAQALAYTPPRAVLTGMAVDPVGQFDPSRSAGILYAGSPNSEGGATKGTLPNVERESAMGYVFAPSLEVPPEIVAESVTGVTQSSARLEGRVNPKGTPTRYVFQYVSDAAYQANEPADHFAGAKEAPVGGGPIEGSNAVTVAATVGGLQAGTEYHYRLVASSHCASGEPEKECIDEGIGGTFRTHRVEPHVLPDRRAYELVTPVLKNGGQPLPLDPVRGSCFLKCKPGSLSVQFPKQSAPDGNSVVFEGEPFSPEGGALIENEYIARRTSSGWQTVTLSPQQMQGGSLEGGYNAFSADLGRGILQQASPLTLSPEAPPGYPGLYAQPSAEPGTLTPLMDEAPPNRALGVVDEGRLKLFFAGGSVDFSHLFFEANDALTPDAQGGAEAKRNLYESSGGELRLVNVAPGGAPVPGAVFGSGTLLKIEEEGNNRFGKFIDHAISSDGSRVFWTAEESGNLYVSEGTTAQIPDPGSCAISLPADQRVCFITASADGSRVLVGDGLLFDVEDLAAPPVDLTQGEGGFEGVVGQSEDLSRIYFVDTATLSGEEENGHGDKAQPGGFNLYAWHEGTTTFLATLPAGDVRNWRFTAAHRGATASEDGRWLAFTSTAPLAGFANKGPCVPEAALETYVLGSCQEVFLYAAETGELRCVSCNPTGTPPIGSASLPRFRELDVTPTPHYLMNSGRLFFDTGDSLSAFDTNGRVEDVYEFDPERVGDCTDPAGCVRLISAGRSGADSNFLAADSEGRNVFLTTRDQLVRADDDALIDVYDAREGGGFPPTEGAGDCQGEACLPSVSPPVDPAFASAGFRGPGDPTATRRPRCAKRAHARRAHVARRKGARRCGKHHTKHPRHRRGNTDRGGAK
jgi:hypothetical protein